MKVVGLVVEYNPFHFGHLYHLKKAKEISGATHVVCIMSGNFMQRGEPAIVNKWARAEMAIYQGADLVLELPVCYSLQTAQFFAYGAVSSLHLTGIADYLCFGSESGDLPLLKAIAGILLNEPEEFRWYLKSELNKGIPYPKAQANSLINYINKHTDFHLDEFDIHKLTHNPNNILGIEYLKALAVLNSPIEPISIKRIKADYHSDRIKGKIASATAIRKDIFCNNGLNVAKIVPKETFMILNREFSKGTGPISSENFYPFILYLLRRASKEELLKVFDVSEGLENRIVRESFRCKNLSELITGIKTKRYTRTRIQRILFNFLLGINKNDVYESYQKGPQYLRVLGFSSKGKELINKMKITSRIPIITKAAHYKKIKSPFLKKMFEYDILATDIYSLAYKNPKKREQGRDFFMNPIILE